MILQKKAKPSRRRERKRGESHGRGRKKSTGKRLEEHIRRQGG